MNQQVINRIRGVAVGAAVGDALGMPLEFNLASDPGQLVRDMGNGRLPAGSFTDDTETALALAESLIANQNLDVNDIGGRLLDWYRQNPSDVGIHTTNVLESVLNGQPWEAASDHVQQRYPESAGNGSVMRCWPVAIRCWQDGKTLDAWSRLQSRVTHAHEECMAGCAFVNGMIAQMIAGSSPAQAYEKAVKSVQMPPELLQTILLAPHRKRDELRNTGWVRHTIESALWGLLNTNSFEEALVQVINLGEDADTAGAVTGALAGAAYGLDEIPERWKSTLQGEWPVGSKTIWRLNDFIQLADQLAGNLHPAARQIFKTGGV